MKIILLVFCSTLLQATCLPVRGDRIVGRDLAGIIPEFARIPDETIGLAPMPTVRRVMSGGELVRIGRRFGLAVSAPTDVCFESPTEVLTAAKVLAEMEATLQMEGIEIELIEFSRYPVPVGELSFPKSGLNVHPLLTEKSIAFWRGKIAYGGSRSYSVWARVRMSIAAERLVTAKTIRSGAQIAETDLRMERLQCFPLGSQSPLVASQVIGMVARRTIPSGQILSPGDIARPKEVVRGAEVSVVVTTDGTQLSLPARAQSSGAMGETVSLKNPLNGRSFRGVVNGKNQATVVAK